MNDRDPARAHLWVSGVVQGVGFRYFAQRAARALSVSGSARNLPDGRVEIVAEGPAAEVDAFVSRIRSGAPGSTVTDVRVEWETPAGLRGFAIR